MPLTVLIGGARSGKSSLAVELASRQRAPVVFVATAEGRDEEMAKRIASHRAARPPEWTTIEAPLDLTGVLSSLPADACVVVDCLTLWVSNLMEAGRDVAVVGAEAAAVAAARPGLTIAVTNEVGSGIVPGDAGTRLYRDLLGSVNTTWVGAAERALLMVAGRAVPLVTPEELLDG